jgi:cytochrome P450 family 6
MKEALSGFATDVIGNVAFGLDISSISDPNSEFRTITKALFAPENNFFLKALFLLAFPDLGRKLRMKIIPPKVSEFFLNVVRQNLNHRIENKIERNDFFDLLVKMYQNNVKEEEKLTFEELAGNCFIFFNAGFESSSSTVTFALFHLAWNQEIQEKLRDEIRKTLEKFEGKVTYESVQDVKYLEMVLDGEFNIF